MNAHWIEINTSQGEKFNGYLSLPPAGQGPGLLLLQEIFGVNSHIRAVADQYAADGYTVLAPDIFWRQQPRLEFNYNDDGFKAGLEKRKQLSLPQANEDLWAAVTALRAHDACKESVSSLGYCMGGLLSYLLAKQTPPSQPPLKAAVCFYPGGIADQLAGAAQITTPLQFHFGGKDTMIPKSQVEAVRAAFSKNGQTEVHVYPEADHGFNCCVRSTYHAPSASLAHGRTLVFLSGS